MAMIAYLYEAQEGKCFYCSKPLRLWRRGYRGSDAAWATRDHFVPRFHDGESHWTNYVLACKRCNALKGHELPTGEEQERFNFLQELVRFSQRSDRERQQRLRRGRRKRFVREIIAAYNRTCKTVRA